MIAKAVMEKNKIFVNDLFSFAMPKLSNIQLPGNDHFSEYGSEVLAEKVAASILSKMC